MRICLIGKFPPIQGGVSAHTYRYAHALAARGHEVHVVTNAKEATSPYVMLMRDEDWARCEGDYGDGSVTVHWTDPMDLRQFHIPTNNPFVTKLASLGIEVAGAHDLDVVMSYYAEPFAIAGHLVAEAAGIPHVVRTAGSDAGRLWHQPQFKPLYDHVFRSAARLIVGGKVAHDMAEIGVAPERISTLRAYTIPDDVFAPDGAVLDVGGVIRLAAESAVFADLTWGRVRDDLTYLGLYGKLGIRKGTADLLRAVARLKERGHKVGLLIMGHKRPRSHEDYRAIATELGLEDEICQIPFLPNWRVPEFLRRCHAIAYLEQDFPIEFHAPVIAREVMLCGRGLVASTEILRKLPFASRVIHGYNCLAVNDVADIDELTGKLEQALANPGLADTIGARGRELVTEYQTDLPFPETLELVLAETAGDETTRHRLDLEVKRKFGRRAMAFRPYVDLRVLEGGDTDPLFRYAGPFAALAGDGFGDLIPARLASFDLALLDRPAAGRATDTPVEPAAGMTESPPVHSAENTGGIMIDRTSAAVINLCDGVRNVAEITAAVSAEPGSEHLPAARIHQCIVQLFEIGLIKLDRTAAILD